MKQVVLGLGSNLGDRVDNLKNALELLSKRFVISKVSKIYETRSLLKDEQGDYLNLVALVDVDVPARELLTFLKDIERQMGRDFSQKRYGARVIDIDIIDFAGVILDEPDLKLPHEKMNERSFVLYPLRDILPDYIHPISKLSIEEMIKNIKDDLGVREVGGR